MKLASDSRTQDRRRSPASAHVSRPRAPAVATSAVAARTQALMLFGRWLRVSRRGVAVMSGCGCGFDMAIELGELDEMILDYLQQKFSGNAGIRTFVSTYLVGAKKNGLQHLLETLANGEHKLQPQAVLQLLAPIEVSIASIEENHA